MKFNLTARIFLGMILGVLTGIVIHQTFRTEAIHTFEEMVQYASRYRAIYYFKILSDIFLRMIKMIVAPLVLTTLVVGVAKVGNFRTVGRIGLKTILYFQAATIVALVMGLILVNMLEPGRHMQVDLPTSSVETGLSVKQQDLKTFITHVIPASVVDAMANNEILPIVVFSLFFGVALGALNTQGEPLVKTFDIAAHVMFKVTNYVMSFAPFGVFGAIAAVIADKGPGILTGYLYLIGSFLGGLLLFIFGILFLVCLVLGIPYLKLLRMIKDPAILAFSTASSEAAMPKLMEALEKFGVPKRIVSFVVPLGYSFNLDGSIMYMTFATVFIAQVYNVDLNFGQEMTMMLTLMLTSKGMAGVPRASFVVIAGTCANFGIPIEGIGILMGVDQLLDMGRSATNVVGNAVAACVVDRWEGKNESGTT